MANIIMFDGPDGIGKSTLVDAVHENYRTCVVPSLKLQFPSEKLREAGKSGKMFVSAREFLLDIGGGLSTAMATHRRIICDRSFLATMAYQGCTINTVYEYLPPSLFSGKLNSVTIFHLYLPLTELSKRLSARTNDVKVGLEGACGISSKEATLDTLSRLDERFKMASEMLMDSEPWKSSPRFRLVPVDMSDPPDMCLNKVERILDHILF